MKQYLAIDIGGTAIKYGLVGEDANILETKSMPTDGWQGGAGILLKVERIVEEYRAKAEGVCISTAGMVDVEKGEIFYAGPTIPNYIGTKFKKKIEGRFYLPCEVENDVNCAGLAEALLGAGRGSQSCFCLTVGTGIGGCAVLNGKVYHGFSGSACEIGYMNLGERNFQELGAASVMSEKVAYSKKGSPRDWNGLRIFEAAKKGDGDCIRAIEEMCDALGRGIANICYVLNPQVVVLGGGVMEQEEYLYPLIEGRLNRYLLPVIAEHTALRMAKFKNNAGMLGAYLHFRQRRERYGHEGH